MHFIRRPVAFLQVPNFQTPAIFIGGQPDLPPPLDTYLFHGSDLADAAILWLTIDPTRFQFAVQADDPFGNTNLYFGYVFGGAVVEQSALVPMGLRLSIDNTGVTNSRWYEDSMTIRAENILNVGTRGGGNLELFTNAGGVIRAGGNGGNSLAVTPSNATVNNAPSGTGTTTSATFAAMPGNPGTSVDKQYAAADSALLVTIGQTLFMTAAVADAEVGILINGTNTKVCQFFFSTVGVRQQLFGQAKITGLPAGTYVCAMVWRRAGGGGTVNVSAFDSFSLNVQEVAA